MKSKVFALLAMISPLAVLAADPTKTAVEPLIKYITDAVNTVAPVVAVLAGAVFLWGAAQFVFGASDEKKRGEGRTIMIYSLVGIVLVLSVWSIVNIFLGFGFGTDVKPVFK